MREAPGEYITTFNQETGQFETKQKDQTTNCYCRCRNNRSNRSQQETVFGIITKSFRKNN